MTDRVLAPIVAAGLLLAAGAAGQQDAGSPTGEDIYASACIDCHGPMGQGTDYYGIPLVGDLPVSQLARLIEETMPEGDPGACVGRDAREVARHIHESFYSPIAQARIRPPRRELSRLTVRQFEQSLADAFQAFGWRRPFGDKRGMTFVFRRKVNVEQVGEPIELVLKTLDFMLADLDQLPESFRDSKAQTEAKNGNKRVDVHVNAHGGVWAPVTGEYEFFVRSDNPVELSVNGKKIIDARIRVDEDSDVRGGIRLIGGRAYPVSLITSRVNQDDLRVTLGWRRPEGLDEVVPLRWISPEHFPAVYANPVSFPPDDRSTGYVRGATVSPEWWDAAARAALAAAEHASDKLPALTGSKGKAEPTRESAIQFCERFGGLVFRRPLTESELQRYVASRFEADDVVLSEAVEKTILGFLTSPYFLYPDLAEATAVSGPNSARSVANRLAMALWDSLPDKPLLAAAGKVPLNQTEAAGIEARRMLGDDRARAKLARFFEHWLRLDHASRPARDPGRYPGFNQHVAADMRVSLELMIEDIVWRGDGDLRKIFLTNELFVNRRLAEFLGVEAPLGEDQEAFVKALVDTNRRAGVVSHPFMVASLAYYRDTSPIHRGVFLARSVLGRSLRPPPEAVAPLAPELAPELTTRERVTLQTSPGACQGCHVLINDLGFALEEFDAVGKPREADTGKPIDPSGGYVSTDGRKTRFHGARELAEFLADEEDVHRSFVEQLFEHLTKQPMLSYGVQARERLLDHFRDSGYNIRELMIQAAVLAATHPEEPQGRRG